MRTACPGVQSPKTSRNMVMTVALSKSPVIPSSIPFGWKVAAWKPMRSSRVMRALDSIEVSRAKG